MFLNIPWIEWIGYVGSVAVAISLTMSSILRLRWFNLAGSAIFSFYGFAIGSLPVGLLNLFIALVNIYYLNSLYSRKEAFKLLSIESDNAYLDYFLDYYQVEIKKFFPDFTQSKNKILNDREKPVSLIILRNAAVAGIFLGDQQMDELKVYLDFVIPEYRDMKPGHFLFRRKLDYFRNKGIRQIVSQAKNEKHFGYLKHMGFVEKTAGSSDRIMVKNINQ